MKLRFKMAWAVLRNRTVCHRVNVAPNGVLGAQTKQHFFVGNRHTGL